DRTGTRDFAHEKGTKAPEGATAGATTGGVLGGAAGWLVGIGALAIPVMGPLSGAAVGAAAGGLTGALVGLGVPEYEAKQYEGKIRDGNILISVHTENGKQVTRAKEIFKNTGAKDIAYSGEASVKAA